MSTVGNSYGPDSVRCHVKSLQCQQFHSGETMNNLIHSIFDGKRTIILGFGREGKESFNLISKYIPSELITIADKNDSSIPDNIKKQYHCITGPDYLENINYFDIIVKSPGISEHFMEGIPDDKITSQTDIFLQQYH